MSNVLYDFLRLCFLIQVAYIAAQCDVNWSYGFNQCYRFFPGPVGQPLTAAVALCANHSAIVAVVKSEAQNDLILGLRPPGFWLSFLGARDEKKEGWWIWSDGTPMEPYSNWLSGEPSNGLGREHCLNAQGYGWNDVTCSYRYMADNGYVCQKATSTPASKVVQEASLRKIGHKIQEIPLVSVVAQSDIECAMFCNNQNGCLAFNLCLNGERFVCELLNTDKTHVPVASATCDTYYIVSRDPVVR